MFCPVRSGSLLVQIVVYRDRIVVVAAGEQLSSGCRDSMSSFSSERPEDKKTKEAPIFRGASFVFLMWKR